MKIVDEPVLGTYLYCVKSYNRCGAESAPSCDIGTGVEESLGMVRAEANARGRVLAVDHDEVQLQTAADLAKPLCNRSPSSAANHIAQKEKFHEVTP